MSEFPEGMKMPSAFIQVLYGTLQKLNACQV
jgi:hypothetical protein